MEGQIEDAEAAEKDARSIKTLTRSGSHVFICADDAYTQVTMVLDFE